MMHDNDAVVLPLNEGEAILAHKVLCSTPHIYYSLNGGTYALSAEDYESTKALRVLTSTPVKSLILRPDQASLLISAVARLHDEGGALDEVDWFYSMDIEGCYPQWKTLLSRLEQEGYTRRKIYTLRPSH